MIENGRVFFDFGSISGLKGSPDGMCEDVSGNLWVACWKGSSVIKIDGNTGIRFNFTLTFLNIPCELSKQIYRSTS